MSTNLNGRTIVVTGGTGALGSAVVKRLLDDGASIHVTWLHDRELKSFALADRVTLHQADCSDEKAVADLYPSLGTLWASIHLVGGFAIAPATQTSGSDFEKMFRVNAMTCFLCCREAIRAMRGKGGRIVNVAARPAILPVGGMVAYSTSKAAVASITQCLADEVKQEDILINAIAPSIMDTPLNRAAMPKADFSQWPKVEQVAEAIAFLVSPANSLTSGAIVPVFGKS